MAAIFSADAYQFTPLGLPYVACAIACVPLVAYALFTRGNPVLRSSFLAIALIGLVFSAGDALTAMAIEHETALALAQLHVGPVSLFGPAVFAMLLAANNRLHRYRGVLALAVLLALASCAMTWTTDLVIADMWKTSWGLWYGRAGPLNELHLANVWVWSVIAVVLAARGMRRGTGKAHQQRRMRRLIAVVVLAAFATTDALLANGIGVYPMSWLPILATCAFAMHGLLRQDLLRATGRDVAAALEIAILAGLVALLIAVFAVTRGAPLLTIALAAPLLLGAQATIVTVRARARSDGPRDDAAARAMDQFLHDLSTVREPAQLARITREVLEGAFQLSRPRVMVAGDDGLWRDVERAAGADDEAEAPGVQVDARVRAWLGSNREPLIAETLATRRLGGLRAPVESFLRALDAELVVPLVDREQVIGALIAGDRSVERALSDHELALLGQLQHAVVRALTYLRLYSEAEQRIEIEREVQVAAAVQHARTVGREQQHIAGCEVVSHYRPAGQFGGDWWTATELPDGRLLVAIGDVAGHGVPAALVTAAVDGCCATAQELLGANFELLSLLQLLNRSVKDVGHGRYVMSCFAALVDRDSHTVAFANGGHPFPYVVAPASGASRKPELRALVSRGTPLGFEDAPPIAVASAPLRDGEILVLSTDALVVSANAAGVVFGERRLQRAIRRAAGAGDRAADAILDEADAFFAGHPLVEDMTLVCVRYIPR